MKYKYFVARDKFAAKNGLGYLYLYGRNPERGDDCWQLDNEEFGRALEIDPTLFPELKWEDEPIEVEITIKRAIKRTMKDEATAVPSGETGLNFVYYKNPMSATVVESSKKDITGAIIPSQVMYKGVVYDVTSISWFAFRVCTSLTSIVIPNSVTTIGESAFYGCTSLTSIEIPNSVTTIGGSAFEGCFNLKTARVPVSLKGKVEDAFPSTCEIEWYGGEETTAVPADQTGLEFWYDETTMTARVTGVENMDIAEVIIPSQVLHDGNVYDVTGIRWGAFWNYVTIVSVMVPESVTELGEFTFYGCANLKTAKVPTKLKGEVGTAFPETCEIEFY